MLYSSSHTRAIVFYIRAKMCCVAYEKHTCTCNETATYSEVQPQVYKRVRVTRVTRKFAGESCRRACARHASDEQSTRVRYFTRANTRNLSRVLASSFSQVLCREYSQSLTAVLASPREDSQSLAVLLAGTHNHF